MTEAMTDTLLSQFTQSFTPDKAAGVDAVIQLKFSGENGGDWYMVIKEGQCNLVKGLSDSPSLTLESTLVDFKDMVAGKIDPVKAFMSGRLRFSGNMMVAMKLAALFGKPA
jgi:putative sterol carrier protein